MDLGNDDDGTAGPPAAKRVRKTEERVDLLSSLPNEILLPILSHLSTVDLARVCRVNRRFRDICGDVALQKRLQIKHYRNSGATEAFEKIDKFKNLEELVVTGYSDGGILPPAACRALEKCPKLQTIDIYCPSFRCNRSVDPSSLLEAIGTHGKSLRTLKIKSTVSVDGLQDNVQFMRNLTHLQLRNVSKGALYAIAHHCKKLKSFDFNICPRLNDMNYYLDGLKDSLEEISVDERFKRNSIVNVSSCRRLRKVVLMLERYNFNIDKMRRMLESIVKLPMLKVLNVSYFPDEKKGGLVEDDFVRAFTDGNTEKSIEVLYLSSSLGMFNDSALAAIADSFHNSLTTLSLSRCDGGGITDEGVRRILHDCRNLVKLHLFGPCMVSPEAFGDVRAPLTELKCCCVDDSVLTAISEAFHASLTRLALSRCSKVTDVGVRRLLHDCKELVDLKLFGDCKVSSEAFRDARGAPLRSFECKAMGIDEMKATKKHLGIGT